MEQVLTTTTEAAVIPSQSLDLFNLVAFKDAYRVAEVLAKSQLIPKAFQGNVADCLIAMEMAQRIGAGVFAVTQSLYIVHGKPGWSATFIIGALNACGRFAPLRFDITDPAEKTLNGKKIMDRVCTAWTIEKGTGAKLEGPPVSIEMAHREGWFDKNGSKWQTMPELMLRYRAATFFGRLYAPDILMGMRTAEELHDYPETEPSVSGVSEAMTVVDDLNARFGKGEVIDASTGEVLNAKQEPPPENPTADSSADQKEQQQQDQPGAYAPEITPRVKTFMKEINQAATGGSIAVDTWRAKHHNRVANACGGVESADFMAVRDYADMVFRELEESEKEAAANKQGGGVKNGGLF